jgi:phosphate uptake regulator
MKRKLIKQGDNSLTLTLPRKWTKAHNLSGGDEVNIEEEDESNRLLVDTTGLKKQLKSTTLTIEEAKSNEYRSLIGGLYRGGYDQIKIKYNNPKVISELQRTVNSLYGFEIFDVKDKSCVIRSVFNEEPTEITSHFRKMIYLIKVIQDTINEDISSKKYDTKLILEYRNNVLKQRDIIQRTITQQKLIDSKHFPYYALASNLWTIARNYYFLYQYLETNPKITNKDKEYIEETNNFFNDFFKKTSETNTLKVHKKYTKQTKLGTKLMNDKKHASLLVSYCLFITQKVQACNSHILLLNH